MIRSAALRMIRRTYRWGLPYIHSRGEIPHILNSVGLVGEGAEIGVKRGDFSRALLRAWKGSKLYSIDPWKEFGDEYEDIANVPQEAQDDFYRTAVDALRPFGNRSKILRSTSEKAADLFDDGQLDFVYLDAQHHYEAIRQDILLWWPKIKKGGLLAGHDYLDGVSRHGKFGVKSAVDEFVARAGSRLFVTRESAWKSWLVFKTPAAREAGAGVEKERVKAEVS